MRRHLRKRSPRLARGPSSPVRTAVGAGLHVIIPANKALGLTADRTFGCFQPGFHLGFQLAFRADAIKRRAQRACLHCASWVNGVASGWCRGNPQEYCWRFCMGNATSSRVAGHRLIAVWPNVPLIQ
jgi:hypothetical protein